MTTTMNWTVVCSDCGKRGPEAETSPEARQFANEAGWYIGGKLVASHAYCPQCRHMHDRVRCNHKQSGSQCVSDSRYRLSRAGELYTREEISHALISLGIEPAQVLGKLDNRIKYSSEWWACGKHLPVFARDMLNATPEPVVLVRVS